MRISHEMTSQPRLKKEKKRKKKGNDTNKTLQLPGSTDTAASFEFIEEGHTMGNALRYIIMKKCVAVSHDPA